MSIFAFKYSALDLPDEGTSRKALQTHDEISNALFSFPRIH